MKLSPAGKSITMIGMEIFKLISWDFTKIGLMHLKHKNK
jgi:hypothetical protein